MIKLIPLFVLCTVLAVAKGNLQEYNSGENHADDYISLNRLQYSKALEEMDAKLKHSDDHYLGRIEGVNMQLDMIVSRLVQVEERLNPYELLSDHSKHCVSNYRHTIPTVVFAKGGISKCISDANNEVKKLLFDAVQTRNNLESYYKNNFENAIQSCHDNVNTLSNYTACIIDVVYETNEYTINSQKTFENQLEVAECSAKADIKRALDCSYTIHANILTAIAEANLLIDRCLDHKDQCPPCDQSNSCSESIDWTLDSESQSIHNPFYGRKDNPTCVILKFAKY